MSSTASAPCGWAGSRAPRPSGCAREGVSRLESEVVGAAAAGAVLAAVWEWADAGPGHTDLSPLLETALECAAGDRAASASRWTSIRSADADLHDGSRHPLA